MQVNAAGQYMVPVTDFSDVPKPVQDVCPAQETLTVSREVPAGESPTMPSVSCDASPVPRDDGVINNGDRGVTIVGKKGKSKDYWVIKTDTRQVVRVHLKARSERFTPCQTHCPVLPEELSDHRITRWRVAGSSNEMQVMQDQWTDPHNAHAHIPMPNDQYWVGETIFQLSPTAALPTGTDHEVLLTQWSAKQARQVSQQIQKLGNKGNVDRPFDIIEVFSPPRFAKQAAIRGQKCLSADLVTGWDFRKPQHREHMKRIVKETPPELLVVCPPCTWAGGWFNLNRMFMSPEEQAEKQRVTMLYINFCCELMELQLQSGSRIMFEHPKGSIAWKMPRIQKLMSRMHVVECDMCCFNLRIPGGLRIRKSTQLLVSHKNMSCLGRKCPGKQHPSHEQHQVVAGSHPEVGSVSRFSGRYTDTFVRAVMDCAPNLRCTPVLTVTCTSPAECLVAARVKELNSESLSKMKRSIQKLHENLGHPGNQHLVRLLKHGGASQEAQDLARDHACQQCQSRIKPTPALPAQPDRVTVFNKRIGIDIKHVTGWKVNQRIPALNIIDYASSFQVVVPVFDRVTSDGIRQIVQERWISWAGQPDEIMCDPAHVNISEAMTVPNELAGSVFHITAADAHYQLGKVEVHGGWFNQILERIMHDTSPNSKESWLDCVHAAHCKNELIQVYGMTPAQFIFGRNPKVPENLLDEPCEIIPATAPLYEAEVARKVAVRQSARRAVVEMQDSKALRLALSARPRHKEEPKPGDLVAYWRSQKWEKGTLNNQGRWHGPAIVLGKVGRNHVVVHKRQVLRCAPEQIRPATSEERQILRAPHSELLGLKDAFESGQIASKQYVDLVPLDYPTQAPEVSESLGHANTADDEGVAQSIQDRSAADTPMISAPAEESRTVEQGVFNDDEGVPESTVIDKSPAESSSSSYGPMRRRVSGKNGPQAFYRPSPMRSEDFSEMMNEIMPRLMERVIQDQGSQEATAVVSPRGVGTKRSHDTDGQDDQGPSQVPRVEALSPSDSPESPNEALVCGSVQHELSLSDQNELADMFQAGVPVEIMLASYHQKRGSKEIPHVNQPPDQQRLIDEAKLAEWHVIEGKHAGRLVIGEEAQLVRQKLAHRVMDSRYVVTLKQEEDAPVRVKARWCLLGHRDPDLSAKALEGALQSPTISQVSRSVLFQTIASNKWSLSLGDIKGAFLAAGPLPERYRPLYARLPPGGIPGVPPDSLIEITGHVYGLNDSPSAWQQKLHRVLLSVGFQVSRFDACLYQLRDREGKLVGIYGVHVDDCATGGHGNCYELAMKKLKEQFEFRKWRTLDGDFCGARYTQCPKSFAITMSQAKFANNLRPLHLSRSRCADRSSPLDDKEISCLRAINGSLNWISSQSRPDLSTQVSFSQQSFPKPTVGDALAANNAIRRAKQHADLSVVFRPVPMAELAIVCHSDAAYANAKGGATQAGYVLGFTHKDLENGVTCEWSPAFWKSHRLPRVVNSTLSAEAQSMSGAASMCEWLSLLLAEIRDGPCCAQSMWEVPRRPPCILITDCKSLFDHLKSPSAPSLDDRRTSIDIVIIRESVRRMSASVRWIPTDRMLADGMTKEAADALDLLRACMRSGKYQVSPEKDVLEWRANERDRRKQVAERRAKFSAHLVSLIKEP